MNVLCECPLTGVRQRILEQAYQNIANIIESLRSGLSVSCCWFSGRWAPMSLLRCYGSWLQVSQTTCSIVFKHQLHNHMIDHASISIYISSNWICPLLWVKKAIVQGTSRARPPTESVRVGLLELVTSVEHIPGVPSWLWVGIPLLPAAKMNFVVVFS